MNGENADGMLRDHSAHIFYFYDINNAIKRISRTTERIRGVKNLSRPNRNSFEFEAISWNWNHKYRNLLLSLHRRVLCKAIGYMFEYRLRCSPGSHSSLIESTNIFSLQVLVQTLTDNTTVVRLCGIIRWRFDPRALSHFSVSFPHFVR